MNFFDSADVYSDGASESILGAAIKGRRDGVLLSTKVSIPTGEGPNRPLLAFTLGTRALEELPGMSSSSLIREVRGNRGGIPVVLVSGYVGGAVTLRAQAAGAEEVLQKPLSARDLATSLARVLHVS